MDHSVDGIDRPLDFNRSFSPQRREEKPHIRSGVDSIEEVVNKDKPLAVVELYQMNYEYYLLDDYHRIAAVKEQEQESTNAHVMEYLPTDDSQRQTIYDSCSMIHLQNRRLIN